MLCKVKEVKSIKFEWRGRKQIWVINGVPLQYGVSGVEIKSKANDVLEVWVDVRPDRISDNLKVM